ncbi:MAG TPA: PorT family protein [Candidatus Aminicenantes bacterium]|nr:MAG: hypothetical protein C0168_01180 [Candidatus Aminicenantes bacterium]HEK85707.1 PorT family protein [Candidatus Aminicenantes bacterium]
MKVFSQARSSFHSIKSLGVFIFLLLFLVNFIFAREFWLGIQSGLSLPNLKGGNNPLSQGYSSREAPFLGVVMDYPISSLFSLRTELCYSSQGGQRNGLQPISTDQVPIQLPPGTLLYANFNNETILDYLELPVMLELNTQGNLKFFVDAGAYAGYRVRAKTVTSGTSLIYLDPSGTTPIDPNLQVPFDATIDVSQEINRWNFGLCGAFGVKIPFAHGLAIASARFDYGLSNIQSHPDITGKNKTGALVLSLGYFRKIGR